MIDRVVADAGPPLVEVPVGFKWFVPGLLDGSLGFGGEESAGASFLRRDGSVWTTDKDGMLLALLASEIKAVTGQSPSEHYAELAPSSATRPTPGSTPPRPRRRRRCWPSSRPTDVTADDARRRADHAGWSPRPATAPRSAG